MSVPIELSQNATGYNELMWQAEPIPEDPVPYISQPFRTEAFLIHRSDQPTGTYAEVGRVTNIPHRSSAPGLGLAAMAPPNGPGKVFFRDPKPGGLDLTYHYKTQRINLKGVVHPDDATLADQQPRTMVSFEETIGGYVVNQLGYATQEHEETVTITDATLFADPFVFDFKTRFGKPASTVELTPAGAGVLVVANNVNNTRVTLPVSATDLPYRLGPGTVGTHRLLFENDSGGDLDVIIKYIIGVQP